MINFCYDETENAVEKERNRGDLGHAASGKTMKRFTHF